MKKYIVRLEAEERTRLKQFIGAGKAAAYRIRHANILLAVDESAEGPGMTDAEAARAFNVHVRSIESLRKRLVEEGLDAALGDETTLCQHVTIWSADRNNRSRKIDWQFQTSDARIKLRRLYPLIQME